MPGKKTKILLIEDEALIQEIYQHILANAGFSVVATTTTREAEGYLKKEKFDLIILDLLLPEENGLSFLKRIRKTKEYQKIPVLILTNLEDRRFFKEAQKFQAKDYLLKTDFTPKQLVKKIKDLL